jgi:PKD repeat protein
MYIGYDELHKTTDGGNSWNIITNNETNGGKIDEIGMSKSNSNVIYFSDGANIFTTTNGGGSWVNINNNLPYKTISYIIVHPNDANKVWVTLSGYTASEKVYKTTDGGNSWVNISGTLPNIPVNCIVLDESSNNENLYIGTDLGVFITDSTLTDWNMFNNNSLPNVIVSELEIQYQSNKLIAATFGRGLWDIDLQITSPPIADFSYNDSIFCNIPSDVSFFNNSYYSNAYSWDFGDGNASTATNPIHTYTSFGTFTVTLVASGPLGSDSIVQQSIISIDPNNPCIITLPPSGAGVIQTACNGLLYDVGGPSGNYYDNNNSWITIAPQGSSQITLNFTSFDIEAPSSSTNCNWDYIEIFDGPDTSAISLGQYCNTLTGSPGTIISSGGALTVYLHADAGVNGTGFEANWTCVFPTTAPVTNFVLSDTISCNTTINFTDLSSNGPSTWLWDFGDGNTSILQNPTHAYSNSGLYTIKLTTSNQYGNDSLILTSHLNIIDLNLQTTGAVACDSSSLTLNALVTNGTVNWYSDGAATNLLATGTSFVTPVLSTSTTYYAQSIYDFPIISGGPVDNNFGAGSYFQGDRYLIFDNYKSSTLKSVLVYAGSDGYRTIEFRNSSNAVLSDTTVYIPFSPNGFRVNLNFVLPIENNLQLGVNAANADLFRTSSGAVFPYSISDIVSITGTDASAGYYYFFYDWEVQTEACVSGIAIVDAVINSSFTSNQSISICYGDSVLVGGNYYAVTGNYTDSLTTNYGCDSIINTQLVVSQSVSLNQQINICEGTVFQVGNNIYNTSGIYIDSINFGNCDSIITTNLLVLNSYQDTLNYSICSGDNILINNTIYSQTGVYNNYLTTSQGCDSIIVLNLEVSSGDIYVNQAVICQGETYQIGNNNYLYPGLYSDTLLSANNCDSIISTYLSVTPYFYNTQQIVLCENESYQVGNSTYSLAGIYIDTIPLLNTCDSIITTYLSFSDVAAQIYTQNNNLYSNVTSGMVPYSYLWSTGETTSSISPVTSGIFWLLVTDAYNCTGDTAYFVIDDVNAIHENKIISGLNIFPNPTEGLVTISFESIENGDFTISILNVLSEVIFEEKLTQFSGFYQKNINLDNFAKAVYLIRIETSVSTINKKLILR